jgi:hypothetical protein
MNIKNPHQQQNTMIYNVERNQDCISAEIATQIEGIQLSQDNTTQFTNKKGRLIEWRTIATAPGSGRPIQGSRNKILTITMTAT